MKPRITFARLMMIKIHPSILELNIKDNIAETKRRTKNIDAI